jgi:hypothetical protein
MMLSDHDLKIKVAENNYFHKNVPGSQTKNHQSIKK